LNAVDRATRIVQIENDSFDGAQMPSTQRAILNVGALQSLLDLLKHQGHRVIGPTSRDQAIIYDEISTISDLPSGWTGVK
jgi:hypothetical protein